MATPANTIESRLGEETLEEKSKFIRFERLSELFTYLAIVAGIFLTFLPFRYPFNRVGLYIFVGIFAIFSIFWFRILPKKYSGKTKNIIYYSLTVVFIGAVVYFTRGIQSPVIFLFYLTSLAAAASMSIKETIFFAGFSAIIILSQALFKAEGLALSQSISLSIIHIWGLIATVSYGWFVFREEKRAKEAHQESHIRRIREVNRVKDEFVFIISTKLASPIVTLREYLTIALSGKFGSFSSEQKDILVKTEENSRRLELLVEDLLDLSKIETGKLRLSLEKVDLGHTVGGTLSDFAVQAAEKRISLLYDNPKEKMYVKADSARLHEVVANLVDNAIKYSPSGSRITVRFLRRENFIQVDIEDNGQGVPEEAKKHLFEKFYRGGGKSSKVKGSGLGLFISKQLIERQGGSIWFNSKLGVGSTFSFKLPLA